MGGPFTVSILGAGPAGFALAADIQRHGTETLVYSHPDHTRHADQVRQRGHLEVTGVFSCVLQARITDDMAEAVAFSEVLVLAVPSSAQEAILALLAPFDLRRHTIIAVPGNLFALVKDPAVRVGNIMETNLSPYSCRMDEEQGRLVVFGKKSRVFVSALHNDRVRPHEIQAVFPQLQLKWCSSVVEVCLSNVNGTFHPLMVLFNIGRIEDTQGAFYCYRDGLTRSVANAMEAVDRVRLEIGAAFGLRLGSSLQISNECYNQHFDDLVDLGRRSPPHVQLRAPASIHTRNISEDVADLLVAWHCLAEILGVDASPIMAVIVMVQMATGENYMRSGRNMAKLRLENVSREELVRRFTPYYPNYGEADVAAAAAAVSSEQELKALL